MRDFRFPIRCPAEKVNWKLGSRWANRLQLATWRRTSICFLFLGKMRGPLAHACTSQSMAEKRLEGIPFAPHTPKPAADMVSLHFDGSFNGCLPPCKVLSGKVRFKSLNKLVHLTSACHTLEDLLIMGVGEPPSMASNWQKGIDPEHFKPSWNQCISTTLLPPISTQSKLKTQEV